MKRFFIFPTAFLLSLCAMAQVKISGTVKDNKGNAIAGASISIKDTYDGAVTDSTGSFQFKTTEKGEQLLIVSSIGYKDYEEKIVLNKEAFQFQISLKEKLDELKAVMVTAGTFMASDKKRAAAVLSSLDIVTTGGANGDITSAVKTLPGAQQVGEQEGLFVRGGAGYETKQFIDGTLVNNPFYSSVPDIASRGRFSPFLFKGTVFSTGGYSALYGQALSSALILESIDIPDQSQASASITTVFLGAGYQQANKEKTQSWGVNYGYTNLLPYFKVVKQKPDYFTVPEFHGGDINYRVKTKRGGIFKYYGTFGTQSLGLRRPDIDSVGMKDAFGIKNVNWYNNFSYRENIGGGWRMQLGAGYSTNHDKFTNQLQDQNNQPQTFSQSWLNDKNFALKSQQDLTQARAVFEKKLFGISYLRSGGEYMYFYNKSTYNNNTAVVKDHYKALFSEADLYITNDLAAKAGVRLEHSSVLNKFNVAPRLSMAYKAGKDGQVSLAYGLFYQKPENMQLIQTTNLNYTKAAHYIANYQKMDKYHTFRVEAFYKEYSDLVKTSPSYNNSGKGYAKGIEVFWRDKKTIKNLDYWVSYSYLDTKRDYLNYPRSLQPSFATPHTLSVVTKKFVTEWKTGFNFTYTYATGRPYYNFQYQNVNNKYIIADQGTTKDYHNVGFSLNYLPNLGKKDAKTFMVIVASVTNVLNFDQVYGYNYSYNGLRKEAITPPAKQFFFLGVFLSWGVDRSQDAINANL